MKQDNVNWMKGQVTIQVRGEAPEAFINEALAGGIRLMGLRWSKDRLLYCEVSLSDFFRIKPYLKRTGCRMRVKGRKGLPFMLARAEKRIWFAGGLALFFLLLFILSSLVWKIEVVGYERLSEEQILQAAKKEGIRLFQWSYRLDDMNDISKRLTSALPDTNWVGVEKKGTKIKIQVVEQTKPEQLPLQSPRHLVASMDAVVTQIVAENGKAVVTKNSRVKKGQTLISGIIGNESNSKIVVAKGIVRGLAWYEYSIETPLTQQAKVYTGNKKTSWHLVIGSRMLQVSGFGGMKFDASETITKEEQVSWRNITLPFGRLKKTVMETATEERELTVEEARSTAILQAKADVLEKAGLDAIIVDEIVLHEKTDNGKVYMKVLFEVDQSIVKELPLVHMQGD
ncbi:sporulation protein YqfD [Paenibacillus sp. GXUN7292]|uniref:sporulation protein YqfD n=1 Tax=Paenibacillus sp. GXUN7292 TaxID=3422499 RepID=UPI003D7D84D4